MSWAIGFDSNHNRDIGYGVPAVCDHPACSKEIDRGLSHVCGDEVYGGEEGCGLFFCDDHRGVDSLCECCSEGKPQFPIKPDIRKWNMWKLTDESWQRWRDENPETVAVLQERVKEPEWIDIPNFLRSQND